VTATLKHFKKMLDVHGHSLSATMRDRLKEALGLDTEHPVDQETLTTEITDDDIPF
jgi:hypothetical protein